MPNSNNSASNDAKTNNSADVGSLKRSATFDTIDTVLTTPPKAKKLKTESIEGARESSKEVLSNPAEEAKNSGAAGGGKDSFKPTPIKGAVSITNSRTAFNKNFVDSQGDHIIANALLKSFLLSVDSMGNTTSFSDQAGIYIAKTVNLIKLCQLDSNDSRFTKRSNELLQKVIVNDREIQEIKSSPIISFTTQAINIINITVNAIKPYTPNRDFASLLRDNIKFLRGLSRTLPIDSKPDAIKSVTNSILGEDEVVDKNRELKDVEQNNYEDLSTNENQESKQATEDCISRVANIINPLDIKNIQKVLLIAIDDEYNKECLKTMRDLENLRNNRNKAFSDLARHLARYCTKNITLITSPHYKEQYKNEQKGMQPGAQEGSAKANLIAISNILSNYEDQKSISGFLQNIYKHNKSKSSEALKNVESRRILFANCRLDESFRSLLAQYLLNDSSADIFQIPVHNQEKQFIKGRDNVDSFLNHSPDKIFRRNNNKVTLHESMQEYVAANIATFIHFPFVSQNVFNGGNYYHKVQNKEYSQIITKDNFIKVLSMASYMTFNAFSGLNNTDIESKKGIVKKLIKNVIIEKDNHKGWCDFLYNQLPENKKLLSKSLESDKLNIVVDNIFGQVWRGSCLSDVPPNNSLEVKTSAPLLSSSSILNTGNKSNI